MSSTKSIDTINWSFAIAHNLDPVKYYTVTDINNIVVCDRTQYNGWNQNTQSFTFTCNGNQVEINNISNFRFTEEVN